MQADNKTIIVHSVAGSIYEHDLSNPYWARYAQLRLGSYAKYHSIDNEWHVFVVEEGLMYGRKELNSGGIGLSVIVRRVCTGQVFCMPPDKLYPCDQAFLDRDGTKVRRGERLSYRS